MPFTIGQKVLVHRRKGHQNLEGEILFLSPDEATVLRNDGKVRSYLIKNLGPTPASATALEHEDEITSEGK